MYKCAHKGGGYETAPRDFFRYRCDLFRHVDGRTGRSHSRPGRRRTPRRCRPTLLCKLALKKKDAKAVGALLDQQFTWTNEAGQTLKSAQFLRDAAAGTAVGDTEYTDVKAHDYGQLAVVTGIGKRTRTCGHIFRAHLGEAAGRLAAAHASGHRHSCEGCAEPASACRRRKRPGGFRRTAKIPAARFPTRRKQRNKKKSSRPIRPSRRRSLPTTRRPGPITSPTNSSGIGRQYTGSPDTKAGRVGQIGITTNRVVLPKMLWGEAYVFGDAAIIIADHQPVGEPPYHVIRVWVNRDGRWQLFHRQETFIEKASAAK